MFFLDLLYAFPGGIADGLTFALLAVGVFITYKILDFADLTVDGSIALGGALTAQLIFFGCEPVVAMLAAFAAGGAAGLVTALLHTKLKIPGILSSILTMLALYTVNFRIMGNSTRPIGERTTIFTYMSGMFPGLPLTYATIIAGVLLAGVIIALVYCFMGTEFGAALRATGNNAKMAKAQGINTDTTKIVGLILSNALVALAGSFIAQASTSANVDMGRGAIVIGLASVIIGEMIFGKNRPFWARLISVVLGAVIYRLIIVIALQLGLKTEDLNLVSSIIVVVALCIPFVRDKIKSRRRRVAAGLPPDPPAGAPTADDPPEAGEVTD
ncbi:MAG: ABC transporter permease [Clostridiales bacterium]|jgi:putative ABC transport system permease protein|nr:ABC transporter permease [Clostridiales bacterium]